MMKMHKMNFTSEQLGTILDALEYAINDNYSNSDPINAHIIRIIHKIENELEETEEKKMECPKNRCPICWNNGIDSLKIEDGDYCQEHEEEL